jgi:flagellar biosynthesis protein FliR
MPNNLTLSLSSLFGFLLTLARVSGAIALVPLPGMQAVPGPARVILACGIALALVARWPSVDGSAVGLTDLAGWAVAEAAVGLAIGVAVAMVLETFAMGAQILGLQAGYGYASAVDPATEADSGLLLILARLTAGSLFFAAGFDREVIRLFARSMELVPPGRWVFSGASAEPVIRLGASLFSVGARIAMPVIALLLMVDVALALMGRLNQQLQLLSLAFPAKMLTALWAVGFTAALLPRLATSFFGQVVSTVLKTLGA